MKISIKLMGMLKAKTPADGVLELPTDATIADALSALDIAAESIQACSINGTIQRDRSITLSDGDEVTVLPPVGGG